MAPFASDFVGYLRTVPIVAERLRLFPVSSVAKYQFLAPSAPCPEAFPIKANDYSAK
jgi:hypothetical protein